LARPDTGSTRQRAEPPTRRVDRRNRIHSANLNKTPLLRAMNEIEAVTVAREAIVVLIKMGAPAMLVSLAVGLTIAIFQALTQIQEVTLTFVPKILALFATVLVFVPFMLETLTNFTQSLMDRIIALG
jgi:flagellar biosynthetic protein FliQ